MAGGKLSPRQKMINMMYLVLMALLALNVSAEILDAFEIINKKLQAAAMESNSQNENFVKGMKEAITEEIENENKRSNIGLRDDTLDMIRNKTKAMIAFIDAQIDTMTEFADYDSLTGEHKRKGERERNHHYWLGNEAKDPGDGRGAGKARVLRDSMDSYANWVYDFYNSMVKDTAAKLDKAMLREDIEANPDVPNDKFKTWELHTFEGPVIANMSILQSLKEDIYDQEKELLELLQERLGVAKFKIDKLEAITAPEATIVPAGLQFKTRLYVTMSSSQITPKFSATSSGATVKPDGNVGVLTVGANGNVIPKGKKEGIQKYSANITVPKATGGFETLPVKGEFKVRLPEVVVTSASVQLLYRNCGNFINIDVPALGEAYDPSITASSATVKASKESKIKYLIVPTGKTCKVGVSTKTSSGPLKIGDVDYKVVEPPKPSIRMVVNGKEVSGATPIPKGSRIGVSIVPDPEFKSSLPADANYGISKIEVLAQLSLGPPSKVGESNTSSRDATKPISIPLGPKIKAAPAGTKVYIRVDQVFRKNFVNKRVPDRRFSEVERTLSLVVR